MQFLPLTRDVFSEAPSEANLPPHQLLKILLSQYGLLESSSCLFSIYYPRFTSELGTIPSPFDPCFEFKIIDRKIIRTTGLANDDTINTGNNHLLIKRRNLLQNSLQETKQNHQLDF